MRAAFYALTDDTAPHPEGAAELQALAIEERAFAREDADRSMASRKKLRGKKSRDRAKDGSEATA